jgi:CheY-like chemotaxis protein
MALVGVIEPGSVERILQSVSFAKADVLVLFSHEGQSGHVLLERGKVVTARLAELRDDAALAALKQWTVGHYTLVKRGHAVEGVRGHVALNIIGTRTRRTLERWLKQEGYETSVVGHPDQALQVIEFLQPDVLLTACPKQSLALTCSELAARLKQASYLPPAVIALDAAPLACAEPSPPCVRVAGTVESLQEALDDEWPGTRLGVRKASAEATAKVVVPVARARSTSDEVLADAMAALPRDRLSLRDILLAASVLALGSGAIWIYWWLG